MSSCSCVLAEWVELEQNIRQAVRESLTQVLSVIDPGDHIGGYFGAKIVGMDSFFIEPILIGEVRNFKAERYQTFCKEKANRLEAHFISSDSHFSSFQSRDVSLDRWGGAVMALGKKNWKYIFSFSGLPELADEALVLLTAMKVEFMTLDQATMIARLSNNDIFFKTISG